MNFYRRKHFSELWSIIGDFKEINCEATVTDEGFAVQSDDIKITSNIKKSKKQCLFQSRYRKEFDEHEFFPFGSWLKNFPGRRRMGGLHTV